MNTRLLALALIMLLSFCGCSAAKHSIGYNITQPDLAPPNLGNIYIAEFSDQRPVQERTGTKEALLTFCSKDAHFSQEVAWAIKDNLAQELSSAGFIIAENQATSDYQINGVVQHFQAVIAPAKITFLPYLGQVSSLWAKDDFIIALSIYIKMTNSNNLCLIDRDFRISQELQLPAGLLNLARYSRGFNYKLKLLDQALEDVLGQIRNQVTTKVKNEPA